MSTALSKVGARKSLIVIGGQELPPTTVAQEFVSLLRNRKVNAVRVIAVSVFKLKLSILRT